MGENVLLIEDESFIRENVKYNLELRGYSVDAYASEQGIDYDKIPLQYHLVILDIMLPKVSGIDICKKIRQVNEDVPILFLTAKNRQEDVVEGLKTGADDYMVKPFDLEEFFLRVKKLITKSKKLGIALINEFQLGKNKINLTSYEISRDNEVLPLNTKETRILALLYKKVNNVVSRDEILQDVWGKDVVVSSRTVDNFILALRKKLEENPSDPKHIISYRGQGYKLQL